MSIQKWLHFSVNVSVQSCTLLFTERLEMPDGQLLKFACFFIVLVAFLCCTVFSLIICLLPIAAFMFYCDMCMFRWHYKVFLCVCVCVGASFQPRRTSQQIAVVYSSEDQAGLDVACISSKLFLLILFLLLHSEQKYISNLSGCFPLFLFLFQAPQGAILLLSFR